VAEFQVIKSADPYPVIPAGMAKAVGVESFVGDGLRAVPQGVRNTTEDVPTTKSCEMGYYPWIEKA